METKEKAILYLNTNLVNSLLSQHNGGLVSGVNTENSTNKKMHNSSKTGGKTSATVGAEASAGLGKLLSSFNASVDGKIMGEIDGEKARSKELSEGQKDIINKTFHDYSLNILLEDLSDMIKSTIDDTKIGDLVQLRAESKLYDFELLSELIKTSNVNGSTEMEEIEDDINRFKLLNNLNFKMVEELFEYDRLGVPYTNKQKKYYEGHQEVIEEYRELYEEFITEKRGLQNINILHGYLDGISLLTVENSVSLIEKNYLYEPSKVMGFRANDKQKINIVGRVINITENDYGEITEDLSTLPLRMIERLLKMIQIINVGTRIIEPIAIYY